MMPSKKKTSTTVALATLIAVAGWMVTSYLQPAASIPAKASSPEINSEPVLNHVIQAEIPADIVRDPTDLPSPIGTRGPRHVTVDLETVEVTGTLASGTTYRYWTFNRRVPGPFVRVRVGDTVEVRLRNDEHSKMMHNVDFHAVLGPGGGAKATETMPGEARGFEFKATQPGVYVYTAPS